MTRIALKLLVLGLAALLTGCQSAGLAGVDKRGQYALSIDGSPYQVITAAKQVLGNDYKCEVSGVAYTDIDGKLVAVDKNKQVISVWVDRQDDESSRMSVTIGAGGDRTRSIEILNRTRDQAAGKSKSRTASVD